MAETRYHADFADQAFKLCLLGLIDKELAEFFCVNEKQIGVWRKKYPEFDEALTRGKLVADGNVAHALYHRALGYSHLETKVFMYKGQIIKTKVRKQYAPDLSSQVFWLTNRQKQKWNRNPMDLGDESPPMKVTFEVVEGRK